VSLNMMQAVHESRIEARLRYLAQTLAFFASDDSRNIFPGVRLLMTAMGLSESTVRAGLAELLATGVLMRVCRSYCARAVGRPSARTWISGRWKDLIARCWRRWPARY
jgi:hypothetical protein